MAATQFNCSACAQPLEAPERSEGSTVLCPACQKDVRIPEIAAQLNVATSPNVAGPASKPQSSTVCAICLDAVGEHESRTACPDCRAHYHVDCWQENGGCAVYGCAQVPAIEHRQAIEIPVSYWGQENKPCPSCGKEILAVAKRCRHCGATFASARPQGATEFQHQSELEQRLPRIRRTVVWLFVCCVVPGVALAGAVWGLIWYPSHKEEVNSLPSLYPALCKIGLGVAICQVGLMVLMGLLFAAFRGG